MNLYKWLWSNLGGRPWTYIYRDIYRKFEYFIQLQWLVTGITVFYYFGLKGLLCFWISYTYGYINGHFFWGTKYVEGQKEKTNEKVSDN